jgi:hypothetical protein
MPTWIRVRDISTGHETDIDKRSMRPGFELVDDPDRWPDLDGPYEVPRPPKYFTGKGGEAAVPRGAVPGEPADLTDQTNTEAGAPAATKGPKR